MAQRCVAVSQKCVGVSHQADAGGMSATGAILAGAYDIAWARPKVVSVVAGPARRRITRPPSQPPELSDWPDFSRPAAGRRGHGFPRSHGPPEHEVKGSCLTLRYRADPSPSGATWIGSGPRAASEIKLPNEPKRRVPAHVHRTLVEKTERT